MDSPCITRILLILLRVSKNHSGEGQIFCEMSSYDNAVNVQFTVSFLQITKSVASGLMPVVEFQNVERTLLGIPFSECVQSSATNNYNMILPYDVQARYTQTLCEFGLLLDEIHKYCGCYLDYIDFVGKTYSQSAQILSDIFRTIETSRFEAM